jgi:hypothetical protein
MSESIFLVGPDLVQFDRSDLPVYETPDTQWAEAGTDKGVHGASLDRLFGEAEAVHVVGACGGDAHSVAEIDLFGEDPLVGLASLSDGVMLADTLAPAPIFEFASDAQFVVHAHEGWIWDFTGADWTLDFHA